MPSSIVKSFAKKTGKTVQDVEEMWRKAKEIAEENGHEDDYDYIVGILKNMLKINETQESSTYFSFTDYLKSLN